MSTDPYVFGFEPIQFQVRRDFGLRMAFGHNDMVLPVGWRARLRELWRLYRLPYDPTGWKGEGRFVCVMENKHVEVPTGERGAARCTRCGASRSPGISHAHLIVSGVV